MKKVFINIVDKVICFFTLLFAIFSLLIVPIGFIIQIIGKFIALHYLTYKIEDKYDLKEMHEDAFDAIRDISVSFRIKVRDFFIK